MSGRRGRHLVLPAALVVSSFALVTACSDDEEESQAGLPACVDVSSSGDCQKCTDGDGDVDCAGTLECFYDSTNDYCDEAIA